MFIFPPLSDNLMNFFECISKGPAYDGALCHSKSHYSANTIFYAVKQNIPYLGGFFFSKTTSIWLKMYKYKNTKKNLWNLGSLTTFAFL